MFLHRRRTSVADGRLLDDALRRAGASPVDVLQNAGLHGFGSLDDVAAVTLERDGQSSFIDGSRRLDADLLGEVAGNNRILSTNGPS